MNSAEKLANALTESELDTVLIALYGYERFNPNGAFSKGIGSILDKVMGAYLLSKDMNSTPVVEYSETMGLADYKMWESLNQ